MVKEKKIEDLIISISSLINEANNERKLLQEVESNIEEIGIQRKNLEKKEIKKISSYENFKNVDNENIEIISYEDSLIEILDNSICLMQLMTPWSIFKNINFKSDTKFFFWNCHPNNLIPSIPIFSNYFEQNLVFKKNFINSFLSKYQKNSKSFLELLLKTHSMF